MAQDITYLGSFDDKMESYLTYGRLDIKALNEILISELLFSTNSRIVLNDGYLVNSPILRQALEPNKNNPEKDNYYYSNSPLFSLIRNEFVSVLSRSGSLTDMVDSMCAQDNLSFINLKRNEKWMQNLSKLDFDLKDNFISWPKFNVGHGFHLLLTNTLQNTPKELGLKVSHDELKAITDNYHKKINSQYQSPRNAWEMSVSESAYKNELMDLANITYHYNFGYCLQSDTFSKEKVYVNTLNNNLFSNNLPPVLETQRDVSKLNLQVPVKINVTDALIESLRCKGNLRDIHAAFLAANTNYIQEKISEKELKKIQKEFVAALISFDTNQKINKFDKALKYSINILCTGIAAGIGFQLNTCNAAIYSAVGGTLVGDKISDAVQMTRNRIKYTGDKYSVSAKKTFARFSSYEISRQKSREFTGSLSMMV